MLVAGYGKVHLSENQVSNSMVCVSHVENYTCITFSEIKL